MDGIVSNIHHSRNCNRISSMVYYIHGRYRQTLIDADMTKQTKNKFELVTFHDGDVHASGDDVESTEDYVYIITTKGMEYDEAVKLMKRLNDNV